MENYSRPQLGPIAAPGASGTTVPLTIVTILFFMWGLLTSLNDVLIPHLKSIYTLSYVQAMLVQFCFFGAYFIASLPAGMLVRRIGYQRGVVAGLVTAAAGCALFYPAATSGYAMFLAAFFLLACGITILQVAANPYVTVLGDPAGASRRLTLTQAFNSLGTTLAPVLGGMLILGAALPADRDAQIAAVQGPYLYLALALLTLAVLFAFARLPRIVDATDAQVEGGSLLTQRRLVLGAVGIFMYVGAEVSVGSFLINYLGESRIAGLAADQAAHYVGLYWGGAMVGRFIGVAVMRSIAPGKALAFNAACSILLILLSVCSSGPLAMWSILAVGLCNSIMFPVIFSMALHQLGPQTGRGSGLLCMAIVGGAIVPFAQGFLADSVGLQASFLIPAVCYGFVLYYGLKFRRD
ncbi:glucose/galactose MFS transporter [Duganella sp. FT80W]|uniref:Glucose/galactose MFS transporter n=1 Tax=Duganella guangzhouensis TaxID=2666084 RepID=A0A6I2L4N0_9BURK|nr:sugar MFS transporter [Duganella guangzhouensis]MRW93265.1 glucose/galactose MFS transporter [Duganella guangzhouensis]